MNIFEKMMGGGQEKTKTEEDKKEKAHEKKDNNVPQHETGAVNPTEKPESDSDNKIEKAQ